MSIENILLGIAAIVIGLICCYAGYGVWRIALVIGGFILGYQVGYALVSPDQWFLALILGIGLALLVGILAYFLWSLSIVLAGAVFGAAGGIGLAGALGLNTSGIIAIAFAVVGLIIGIVLAFLLKDLMIVILMALAGSSAVVFGIALALPFLSFLEDPTGWFTTIVRIIIIGVLAITGILAQLRMYGPRFDGDLYFEDMS